MGVKRKRRTRQMFLSDWIFGFEARLAGIWNFQKKVVEGEKKRGGGEKRTF